MPAFTGRSDYYSDLTRAIAGTGFFDFGGFYDEESRDETTNRLRRYRRAWRFYRGDHYSVRKTDDGREKLYVNFCKKFVDKAIIWLFGRGFTVEGATGNETVVNYVRRVWDSSNKDVLALNLAMYGAVCGDVCAMLQITGTDRFGFALPGKKRGIRIHSVNPMFCFPLASEDNPQVLRSMLLQYPRMIEVGPSKSLKLALHTIEYTPETIREWFHLPGESRGAQPDVKGPIERENPWGFVPFVWFQNLPVPTSVSGTPDINEDIIALNEVYNASMEDTREIVEYHAAPTTIVFGASARVLEKGTKKTWGGLPKDAKVENLRLEGDLSITDSYLDRVEKAMLRLADTPGVLLGDSIAISNTSRAALEIHFLPMFEKTRTKHITYGSGLTLLNAMIVRAAETLLKEKFSVEEDVDKYATSIQFPFPLPIDEASELDADTKKLDLKVTSRRALLRKYTKPGEDTKQIATEIAADSLQETLEEIERARASTDPDRPIVPQIATGNSIGMEVPDLIEEQDILSPETSS